MENAGELVLYILRMGIGTKDNLRMTITMEKVPTFTKMETGMKDCGKTTKLKEKGYYIGQMEIDYKVNGRRI